jgi:hypothetical protein
MNVKAYRSLLRRWLGISLGSSYYHLAQPVGKLFDRFEVRGYYNDLTGKTDWRGETDETGIPVNVLTNGERVYFPTTIAQMALGAYDCWLETGRTEMRERFETLTGWLERFQDDRGGWNNPWSFLRPSCVSGYSAMTQGQAISVLVRAHLLTSDDSWLERARRAFMLLVRPVESGGCSSPDGEDLYLEEYPENPRSTVLNGWVFAVFGLHDLSLVTRDEAVKDAFVKTLVTLEKNIAAYDAGYWSFYDARGTMAGPFYHRLHIALLHALYAHTDIATFAEHSALWRGYQAKRLNKSRAIAVKMWQKLKNPESVMIAR